MSVFNSLGSNYKWKFALSNLFSLPSKKSKSELAKTLGEYYGGQAILMFKGRDALELAFRSSGLPAGSSVGISGFTCYVVYAAVVNAGYRPVFIDLAPGQLNYGVDQLKNVHAQHSDLSAIIVQNTLGYPADMPALASYCHQNKIVIVEDLAHSVGGVYSSGLETGKAGDFTMLSFSQDKPLDAVAGGALIDRRQLAKPADLPNPTVGVGQRLKVRLYPTLTGIVRSTYSLGLGKLLHSLFKSLKIMAAPMNDKIKGLHTMSSSTARLILRRWEGRESEFEHRRQIANIYQANLPKELLVRASGQPAYIRFPIIVNNRESLLNLLKKAGIYIGDTWYDAPVAPKRYLVATSYVVGTCPEAERLVATMINLPTHINVSAQIANDICDKIKQWQILQQKS